MKNLYLVLLSLFTLYATYGQANPINIRVNPFSIVSDGISGGVDLGLTDNVSLSLDGGYIYDTFIITGTKGKAITGGAKITYYSDSMKDDSFITSVGLSKSHIDLRDSDNKKQIIHATTGGVKAGYRWIWDSGFNTSLSGGLAQVRASSNHVKTRGLMPVAELSLGYQI